MLFMTAANKVTSIRFLLCILYYVLFTMAAGKPSDARDVGLLTTLFILNQIIAWSDLLDGYLARKYKEQQTAAEHWEEAFEPEAHAHFEAAESFERAQLCAEIGIVLASIALLLSSRLVWLGAGGLGEGGLEELAVFDDQLQAGLVLQDGDVVQGVAVDRQQVCSLAWFEGAREVGDAAALGGGAGGRDDGLHGRHASFDHALQPEPRREGQPPQRIGRRFGDVEHDDAEIAGLEDERERANRLLERPLVHVAAKPWVRHDVAAHPQQAVEIHPGCRRRFDVEHVERIDERDELTARRGRGEHPEGEAGPPRGARPHEFRQVAARQPAAHQCV